MLKVVVVVVVVEDTEVVVDVVVEADAEEKKRRVVTAHTAGWTTIPPTTAGSLKGSQIHNNKHSHANVREMPAAMIMMSSAINAENLATCAMNAP